MAKIGNLCTLEGLLNLIQVLASLSAIIASSIIWTQGNVALFIYYSGYGWQLLINVILIGTLIFSVFLLFLNVLGGNNLLETIGKPKTIFAYLLVFLLLILADALEIWYCTFTFPSGDKWEWGGIYRPRFIATAVFIGIDFLCYGILLILNFRY
ncbi:unnamed protein product, partial [Mesorhabditis belari]|uniref:MARVEL domain-containing protein n=1 Tax=Mesorhabditis belari TaxID=2138241 RepID=A0AAF3FLV7_9BILA